MAKELTNTLLVDNEEYNVNAVHADSATLADRATVADRAVEASLADRATVADKVAHKLKASKINLTKDGTPNNGNVASDLFTFDGSADATVALVPADGGRFNGRITVPDVSESVLKTDGQTVLNYNGIVNKVVERLINTSTMATWAKDNSGERKLTFTNYDGAVNGICVVIGSESDLLYGLGTNNALTYEGFAYHNSINKWLPHYLYVCVLPEGTASDSETGNIYFGSAGSETPIRLAYRTKKCSMVVDLTGETSGAVFDGSETSLTIGVKGLVPIKHGGTGGSTAKEAREALQVADANHTHSDYQPKILIGTKAPTDANNAITKNAQDGAIYIMYPET